MRRKNKAKSGQNTVEYLIMAVLVAVASIGVVAMLGEGVRNRMVTVIAAVTGNADAYEESQERGVENAKKANENARDNDVNMGGIGRNELNLGEGGEEGGGG